MKYRFWFVKKGVLRFISHLDVNRTMMRALRFAQVPMTYSQGFNPRPILTFALPLSLGIESDCESMDIQTESEISCVKTVEKLNRFLPRELHILNCAPPVHDPKHIAEAAYRIALTCPEAKTEFERFWNTDQVIVTKKTKSGSREIDLKPLVKIGEIAGDDQKCEFQAVLPTGTTENVNPALLTEAFCDFTIKSQNAFARNGLDRSAGVEHNAPEIDVRITRIGVRMQNGEKFV